jgi:molecular chaperone GrpE (heat shock protein)
MAKNELTVTDGSVESNPEGDSKGAPRSGEMVDTSSIFERDNLDPATFASREGATAGGSEEIAQPLESDGRSVETEATSALIEVASGLQDLASKQEELRNLFESRIRSDEVQVKALERLHDQVREYKNNFIRQEMQPLLRDLIFCYDFAADEAERAGLEGHIPTPKETALAFNHLRQMVADVLSKYDIEPYRASGTEFDRREQQCVRTVPTAVESDEKKIAAIGAIGFRSAEQIVRKEQVTVYKYNPGLASEA